MRPTSEHQDVASDATFLLMVCAVPPGGQELQHCKHTLIGEDVDGAVSGISGGERRRVSVGIGLVTDAHAIFLDEPTTGLDSDSAEALISLLSHLAVVKRRTVRGRACN